MSLLSAPTKTSRPTFALPQCGACGLYQNCHSPKIKPRGSGNRRVLWLAESPGEVEDQQGKPLIGPAGQCLDRIIKPLPVELDDCLVSNAAICFPGTDGTQERHIDYCRPTLLKTIREFKPNVIILLGKFAIQSVIGTEWKDDLGEVGRWVGWQIPSKTFNAWLCPTYHPSFVLREDEDATLVKIVRSHIASALQLEHTPPYGWDLGKVDLLSGQEAIWALQKLDGMGQGNVSFDFETNALKSDGPDARIVCASFCHEGWTFAFPYGDEAVRLAMSAVLRNQKLGKIGANAKFEQRWCLKHLRHGVTDWVWDTILAAHCLDNRSHITSVKFQAYVNGGINDYASGTKDYFESDGKRGGNSLNRIDEIPMEQLLQYCGWDSWVEWKLAECQMERMNANDYPSNRSRPED